MKAFSFLFSDMSLRFVPPTDVGGLPVDAFAVEYKEQREDWTQAKRRVWPASKKFNKTNVLFVITQAT